MKRLRIIYYVALGLMLGAVFINADNPAVQLIDFSAFACFLAIGIILHELGHLLAAKAVGWPVLMVIVGQGRELFRGQIFGVPWIINAMPFSGFTFGRASGYGLGRKIKQMMVLAAGSVMNAATLGIGYAALNFIRPDSLPGAVLESLLQPLMGANFMLLLLSLIPFRFSAMGMQVASDGFNLMATPFLKKRDFLRIDLPADVMVAQMSPSPEKFSALAKDIENVLAEDPDAWQLQTTLALVYQKLGRVDDALGLALRLLEHDKIKRFRVGAYNLLAWIYLIKGDGASLDQADVWSKKAIEKTRAKAVANTRGCVLIERGKYRDGLKFLRSTVVIGRPFDQLSNAASSHIYTAYAHFALGDAHAGSKYLAPVLSRRSELDTDDLVLLNRCVAKIERLHPGVLADIEQMAAQAAAPSPFRARAALVTVLVCIVYAGFFTVFKPSAAWWEKVGDYHAEREKYGQALYALNRAITVTPGNAGLWFKKGRVLEWLNDPKAATAAFRLATGIAPEWADAWDSLAGAAYMGGQLDKALVAVDKALVLSPRTASYWYGKGLILVDKDRPKQALKTFNKAITLDPAQFDFWHEKSKTLCVLDRHALALGALAKMRRLEPDDEQWVSIGSCYITCDRLEDAFKAAAGAIALAPRNPDAWALRADVFMEKDRWRPAAAAFEKAGKLDPNYAYAWYGKSMALRQLGRADEAKASLAKAKKLGYKP